MEDESSVGTEDASQSRMGLRQGNEMRPGSGMWQLPCIRQGVSAFAYLADEVRLWMLEQNCFRFKVDVGAFKCVDTVLAVTCPSRQGRAGRDS